MKKTIMIAALGGFLSATAAEAANTNGLPNYPASPEYQRIYKREQYWKNQAASTQSPMITQQPKCSEYPKSAKYRRADRRMGLTKKCND